MLDEGIGEKFLSFVERTMRKGRRGFAARSYASARDDLYFESAGYQKK
jgi:hypothetical protein